VRRNQREGLDEMLRRLGLERNGFARCLRALTMLLGGVSHVLLRLFLFLRFRGPIDWGRQRIGRLMKRNH